MHFAPELATKDFFRRRATEYVTTDLVGNVDITADITSLPFDDNRWDVVVCNHVLEHIHDDASALRELRRVLTPGGVAIIIVPRRSGCATEEDPSVVDPDERRRRFGQEDHVRIYGDDLDARISAAGFAKIEAMSAQHFSSEQQELYRLVPINARFDEAALLCV